MRIAVLFVWIISFWVVTPVVASSPVASSVAAGHAIFSCAVDQNLVDLLSP
jgi:hypothetical protein